MIAVSEDSDHDVHDATQDGSASSSAFGASVCVCATASGSASLSDHGTVTIFNVKFKLNFKLKFTL